MSKRMIGPFELGEKLGTGGMGVVYRATYTKTGAPCAIKLLTPDSNDSPQLQLRFEREIAILKKLQHPHIVRYFGGGKKGSQRFYAMELVKGGSLESRLRKHQQMPWDEVLTFARQIAEALEHAHNAGVIHRDLKPANLLIASDGTIKLTDFGIARDTTATALTAAGKTVGTYAYMAPEQIRGKPPVDRRTDLYALGCVMFEMLAGEPPFDSDNAGEILVKHLQEEPPRVTSFNPQVPIWLEELIFRLLEKEPDERIFDALALQMAIDEVRNKVARQASLVGEDGDAPTKTAGVSGTTQGGRGAGKSKKKKKKRDQTPIYERVWFLAGALCLVLGFLGWQIQRALYPSEAVLFAKAQALMAQEDTTQWVDAKNKYLPQLLSRFPDGQYAEEARALLDTAEMYFAEQQARNLGPRSPKSEGQRLFLEADKFERFGDRVSALDVYESMIELLRGREEDRVYVLLAERQRKAIVAEGGDKLDRVAIIEAALQRADEQMDAGNLLDSRSTWTSIVTLYDGNQELAPYVERARTRLDETRRGRREN